MMCQRGQDNNHLQDFCLISPSCLKALLSEVIGKGVSAKFTATGLSMSPFIKDGDVLTISPRANLSPRLGDVIVFKDPGSKRLLVHRVVKLGRKSCVPKGDNATDAEGSVFPEDILGFVTRVERHGKKVSFGLGPERVLIVLLARMELLVPGVKTLRRVLRPLSIGLK